MFWAQFFMQYNSFLIWSNFVVVQVMLVCGKYNLVYEFFDKVKKDVNTWCFEL